MTRYSNIDSFKSKQQAMALGMSGLVFIAFFAFAYHPTCYTGRSVMMRAKCPVCALVSQGESDLERPKVELHFRPVFLPSATDLFSLPPNPHHRRLRVRGPPVSPTQI